MVKFLEYKKIYTINKDLLSSKVYLYGASNGALHIYKELANENIEIIGVFDSNETRVGTDFCGYIVESKVDLLEKERDITIVIGTKNQKYVTEILCFLNDNGFKNVYSYIDTYTSGEYNIEQMKSCINRNKDKIKQVYEALADTRSKQVFMNLLLYRITNEQYLLDLSYESTHKQYFPLDIINLQENEVFIDAGGYDGETILDFADLANGKYKEIYSLEPDPQMVKIIKTKLGFSHLKNVNIIEKGLYSSSTTLRFNQDFLTGSSSITDEGSISIPTISIDDLSIDKVTFIKMDVEGAEIEGLKGAAKTIERDMPKLAISVYHEPDDLWEIPYLILSEYPSYKLYLRHYTQITTETVCYAIK